MAPEVFDSLAAKEMTIKTVKGGNTGGNIGIDDGTDLAIATSTGTKIGTATGQKIAFYGQTPVARMTVSGTATNHNIVSFLSAMGLVTGT
jgi:hypothetical protein